MVLRCLPNTMKIKETWIKVVGVPIHLWTHQVFKEIGQLCGGWTATEEETELGNHMKWARILVANDGRSIPQEVSIAREGIRYHFPIWAESKVRCEMSPEKACCTTGEDSPLENLGQTLDKREKQSYVKSL
uniref:Putative ovule protein n=1 Tax=Solanum chacoense TaxID=4108 RepID=A0A0V0H7N4_SOLCH